MNKLLNATKSIFHKLKKNARLRMILISVLALLLISGVTLAWYINNLSIWGMTFETGNIQFNAYVYDKNGTHLVGPVASNKENESKYINAPLFTIENAQVGTTGTVYIAVESTGSIGIDYKLTFDITGRSESATAYLGGYKYNITKVTDKVDFVRTGNIDVSGCPAPEKINDEIVTIDRNAVNGTIEEQNGYDIYRMDYTLVQKNEEYTSNSINVYFNIFATQIGGDFDSTEEKGYTYYCSTKEDIDRAAVEAYPGDIIKLSSDIVYYGDLVFNKPINLETNDFTLTVNGNLMYDYALSNSLKIDVGGLGRVVVQCTKEGVGGNLKIKAPLSNVVLTGSNASNGDLVIEKNVTIDATNSVGAPGVNFNNIRIVDASNSRKIIQLESNTRATVSFGTTIGTLQSVVQANNIEIVNNGVIGRINLSNMELLEQTNSPQIYVLNNNDITNAISLPQWSVKFEQSPNGTCSGNTTIIQSFSGSPMSISGSCPFTDDDIEIEKKDVLVEQIEEGNDSRLKIYYQDPDGQLTTIQSILEDYFTHEVKTDGTINEILQLEIISVGTKAITRADITYLNSNNLLSLKHLDMQRANVYDGSTNTMHKLPDNAFSGVSKYETLILPQNLVEIGAGALANAKIENIITIPSDVTVFGKNWFTNSSYVYFASSIPVAKATEGIVGVKAVFVDEAYIESYKNVYSGYATLIYPVSVLDESKQHFVRNTRNDEWEITYFIRGEDTVIGENITMDGKVLTITSIYDNAYRHNYTASTVNFADSVTHLGKANFYSNKNITAVNLKNIKTVDSDAFTGCTGLTQVVFGSALETIGDNVFMNCVSLNQKVTLPSTMKSIGARAFQQSLITEVNTGGAVSIEGFAFSGCQSLIYADMPEVQVVGESGTNALFAQCGSLVSVNMPSLIKTGGNQMFQNCSSLREVYMGATDDGLSMGGGTFTGVKLDKLKMYVPEENLEFFQQKHPGGIAVTMIYPKGEKMGEQLVNGFNIGNYIVGDNGDNTYTLITSNLDHSGDYAIPTTYNGKPITGIYANAYRNQVFTDVKLQLGNSLKSIGSGAFYGCAGLLDVNFGNSLETVDASAFAYCTNLKVDIVLPASMKLIGDEAFSYSGITGINTGGATAMGSRVFLSCASLVYAQMPEVAVIAEGGNNALFVSCSSLVSVDLPKVTKVYGTQMFMSCTSLTEIYMGTKEANITLGTNTFHSVNSAQVKLFVPADLVSFYQDRRILNAYQVYPRGEKIGDKAVNGFVVGDYILMENDSGYTLVASNLSFEGDATVPNTYNDKPITEVYSNAFRNQSFTNASLHLGDNVTVIGSGAFYGCSGLQAIDMDNVTTIADDAFYASGIKVLNAPKLTTVGNNAFRKCINLGIVSIPRMVRIENTHVFAECSSLNTIYFEDVMSLNDTTLSGCRALQKITINKIINSNGDNMPSTMTIEASAPCSIYVPHHSLQYYTNPWSGKPVFSYDTAATYNGDTYILSEIGDGRYALIDFMPSRAITSLTMPNTVTTDDGRNVSIYAIRYGAFSTVSGNMQNITLSNSIAQLDNNALSECRALQNIYTNSSHHYFTAVKGILYSKDKRMLVKYPVGRAGRLDLTAADFEATVGIGASAFENAVLTEIVFPQSLLVIDSTAFENCAALKTVTFTGMNPPALMGSGIFDTGVDGFRMKIPTDSAQLVTDYLCAYNFGEYEPYIDRGGHAAPGSSTDRNQVPITSLNGQSTLDMLYLPPKEDEDEQLAEAPMEDTSGDGPNPPEDLKEPDGTGSGEIKDAVDKDLVSGESPKPSDDTTKPSEQGTANVGDLKVPEKDSKPEDTRLEETKPEETKPEETKPEETKPEETTETEGVDAEEIA